MDYSQLASQESIDRTSAALKANGIHVLVVEKGEEAKQKILEMLPQGAEVMNMTSVTLDTIGVAKEINESPKYNSVRNKLSSMDRKTQSSQMQKLGAAPEWVVGSVHAVTEEGHIFIASNTGSQLPADVYGSPHVIFVVGTQKIVANNDEAFKRIYDHCLPLETKRARKAYGLPETWQSSVNKLVIINKEV